MIDICFNQQREARYSRGLNIIEKNDSYDMEDFAMPLHKFINHPVAGDIVHNGATFQVLQQFSLCFFNSVKIVVLHQFL